MGKQLGYARVSTGGQDVALQVDALATAGVDPRDIRVEVASGADVDRPELAELLSYAAAGDTIVVWKLDRLGRSTPHLIAVVTDLGRRGIGLRSLTDPIDTTTAAGVLTFQIFAALAEFERNLGRERTRAGIEAARRRGVRIGRPPAMTPERAATARAALAAGQTRAAVARTLGISRRTLDRHLPPDARTAGAGSGVRDAR